MPFYSIRYVCECPLISEQDITLEFDGNSALFTFPHELTERGRINVTIVAEAEGWKEADIKAQRFIQPILDAASFATGQPLILSYWDFIRKDEQGSESRKALWCDKSESPAHFDFRQGMVEEAQALLGHSPASGIDLCWHRYAVQRGYWLDRFVFQWLAFENLAGAAQVSRACEECGHVHTHQGSNRAEALRILRAAVPEISDKEFRDEVWGRDRNGVFHGSKYPSPLHLRRLRDLFPKLRTACEMEVSRRIGLPYRIRPTGQTETHFYRYQFFEWKTASPECSFADDFPWKAVKEEFSNRAVGGAWISVPSAEFNPLDFQRDAANW